MNSKAFFFFKETKSKKNYEPLGLTKRVFNEYKTKIHKLQTQQ